ncbi:MAG TPA: MXAN_5187 C-terminal domain-containing protein [Thermoanaerobaculia bacterium]|nr:MXAN_5187 C-terminal domain-containing protein [Thermoanaerobaculia bacterium]
MKNNGRHRAAELDRLERDIHTLRIDFERFFNGDLDVPPEQFRDSIRDRIASLQSSTKSAVDSFRLGALEARFHSYNELFNRRLRGRELQHGPARPVRTARPAADPSSGIVLGRQFDANGVAPLYRHLYSDQSGSSMDLRTFTDYLVRQHQLIRERTGCSQVSFRIVQENGKKKLKARPVREAGA